MFACRHRLRGSLLNCRRVGMNGMSFGKTVMSKRYQLKNIHNIENKYFG